MNNIEVEVRTFISKEKYQELKEFFNKNAKFIKHDNQETHYFDLGEDIRIQKNNYFAKIWFKKGKIHDDSRKELEVKFDKEDFNKIAEIFKSINLKTSIKWFRERYEYKWQDITVDLDYTRGYGYILELEKLTQESESKKTHKELTEKLKELGLEITPKKEFNKQFKYYENNWKKLIKK
ncbi:CYTH domain-containing protein [Patescibacteria group bacterium]